MTDIYKWRLVNSATNLKELSEVIKIYQGW